MNHHLQIVGCGRPSCILTFLLLSILITRRCMARWLLRHPALLDSYRQISQKSIHIWQRRARKSNDHIFVLRDRWPL